MGSPKTELAMLSVLLVWYSITA